MDAEQRVRDRAAEWLRSTGSRVAEVLSVEPFSTEWAGSTEGGFYSLFSVYLRWVDADGGNHLDQIEGENMEALWRHVVR